MFRMPDSYYDPLAQCLPPLRRGGEVKEAIEALRDEAARLEREALSYGIEHEDNERAVRLFSRARLLRLVAKFFELQEQYRKSRDSTDGAWLLDAINAVAAWKEEGVLVKPTPSGCEGTATMYVQKKEPPR
jgi:hypothetical protein